MLKLIMLFLNHFHMDKTTYVLVLHVLSWILLVSSSFSAETKEIANPFVPQEQSLDSKGKQQLEKCLHSNCFYRASLTEFLACAQENCLEYFAGLQKRWIDSGYFSQGSQRRRSTEDELENCIRKSCNGMGLEEMGHCALFCGVTKLVKKKNKRMALSPYENNNLYKEQYIDTNSNFETTDTSSLPINLMPHNVGGNFDEEWSPKRWLDPLNYSSTKVQKPKPTNGRRDLIYSSMLPCWDCYGETISKSRHENIGEENTLSLESTHKAPLCLILCGKINLSYIVDCYEDCLRPKQLKREVDNN